MADGIYYTQADYTARWGDQELVRVTDEDGTGQPDPFTFEQAAADASATVDSYLAGRYPLPLAEPFPRILKAMAGALVRELLHTQFPTETVTREADRARAQLRDLSTGKAKLLLETGEEAPLPQNASSGIAWSAPPRVFTADVLDKF